MLGDKAWVPVWRPHSSFLPLLQHPRQPDHAGAPWCPSAAAQKKVPEVGIALFLVETHPVWKNSSIFTSGALFIKTYGFAGQTHGARSGKLVVLFGDSARCQL